MSTQNISERLRDIRTYHGYTQKEIANYLGISRSAYGDYEIYRIVIPIKHLNSLSNFYNINIDYLLGLTNTSKSVKNIILNSSFIGNRLSLLRKELKLSSRDFANEVGISHNTIIDYEHGKYLISTTVCYNIAKHFNISIDYLLGKSDKKYL